MKKLPSWQYDEFKQVGVDYEDSAEFEAYDSRRHAQFRDVDALVPIMVFHHLSDFWKGIALDRMNSIIRPDGLLYIHDVIFVQADVETNISRWIDHLGKTICGYPSMLEGYPGLNG
jgi:cyclopropane fatty-acyl-phospholipid synthase-like methyltransferase